MKIAIVSDTHGQWQNVRQALASEEGLDYLFFLGDLADDGQALAKALQLPAYIVRGNCDSFFAETDELEVTLGGVHFLLCHGDKYHVKQNLTTLLWRGKEVGADIVCFGHTHMPIYEEGELVLINPGSASQPRLFDQAPSWGLLELADEENEKKVKKYERKVLPKR